MEEKTIQIAGSITVDELSKALGLSVTELIGTLFKNGIVATINQRLDFETASIIIDELGLKNVKLERKNTSTKTSDFRIPPLLYLLPAIISRLLRACAGMHQAACSLQTLQPCH